MSEVDPNGIDAHAPGAKLDAGKLRPHLVLGGFANALEQVVKVGTDGAAKYSDNGWKEVKDGVNRYLDAMGRHRLRMEAGEEYDQLSGSRHLAHLIWNALAVLEMQSQPKDEARLAEIPVKRIHIASTAHEDDFCEGCRHNGPGVRMSEPCSKCDASTGRASRWEAAPSKYRSCGSCYWAGTPGSTTDKCSSCESRGDAPPSNWNRG